MPIQEKIKSGKFVVIGEFEPPKGADFSPLLRNANLVKGRLDAVLVPEMANAVMKASSLGGCAFFQGKGIETIFQVCYRDRNLLALQADILAAGALGIKNIMAVPGEDIKYGDHPHARAVNDVNLLELVETINKLQGGKDAAGIELRGAPGFCMGSLVNTGAPGSLMEMELENLGKMMDLGLEFVITNPIFDLHRFQQFIKRIDTNKIALIPTVLLLKSAGMARYIDRNVRGITIPSEMIRSIQKAPDKPGACISLAADIIRKLKEMGLPGVLISTVGWEDRIPEILSQAGI